MNGTIVPTASLVLKCVTIFDFFFFFSYLRGDEVVESVAFCQVFAQDHPLSILTSSRPTNPEQWVMITALWKYWSHSASNHDLIIIANKKHWKYYNKIFNISNQNFLHITSNHEIKLHFFTQYRIFTLNIYMQESPKV